MAPESSRGSSSRHAPRKRSSSSSSSSKPTPAAAGPAKRGKLVWSEPLEGRCLLSASPVSVDPASGLLTVTGTRKSDVIVLSTTADGHLSVAINGTNTPVDATVTSVKILGGNGNDSISIDETQRKLVVPLTIDGGGGNDHIVGSTGDDTLLGGPGNDSVIGGDGNDSINGGKGNDNLAGGDGADTIVAGGGSDTYNTGANPGDTVDGAGSSVQATAQAVAPAKANPLTFFGNRTGLTVRQIRGAYQFGNIDDPTFTNRGAGQGIAVVIPYNVQTLTQSLTTFSQTFGLPTPDSTNFQYVTATGTTPPADPDPNHGWEAEACLDVEWVHAIAPEAKIYVVLANSDLFPDIFTAVDKATDTLVANNGGGVVALTVGSQNGELDPTLQAQFDPSFTRAAARNVTFVAGAGDISGQVSYPGTSPFVLSVGGSSLNTDTNGNLNFGETAWSGAGGGVSPSYPAPAYQQGRVPSANRATPDVAYNADPAAGVAVFDATPFGDVDGDFTSDSGWIPGGAGGTSAAVPQWAGLIALANQVRAASGRGFLGSQLTAAIYDLASTFPNTYFNDITTGASGPNAAGPGYDLVTGWGSPKASALIDALSNVATTPLLTALKWTGEYRLPIQTVGPLAGQGGGFFVGTGAASASSTVNVILDANTVDLNTPVAIVQQFNNGQGTGNLTSVPSTLPATITSLTLNPATRDPKTGKFSGLGTVSMTVQYFQPSDPVPPFNNPLGVDQLGSGSINFPGGSGGGGGSVSSGGGTGTGTTGSGTGNSTGGGTTQPPQQFIAILTGPIAYAGKVYTSKSGRQHIRGTFQVITSNQQGQQVLVPSPTEPEGSFFLFRGKFHD